MAGANADYSRPAAVVSIRRGRARAVAGGRKRKQHRRGAVSGESWSG